MTKIFRLANGVTCVSEERPDTGRVVMQVHIKSGSQHERAEENGLTFLMQASTKGGTLTQSRAELAEAIESKGGSLGTSTGRMATVFEVDALARYAAESFTVLADMIRHPAFDDAEVQKTKTQIDQWIDKTNEKPENKAQAKFYEQAFSGQAAGLPPMGSQKLLASFTPDQVKQKHAEMLSHPENIVISIAGDITTAEAEKLAESLFGDLPKAATTAPVPQVAFVGGDSREVTENKQLNLIFGFKAPSLQDQDRFAVQMLREFLSGGMSAPLFQEIREKRGLVYSVGAGGAAYETAGFFNIMAGTGKGNAGELIAVAMDLLGKTIREGVDQATLDQTRDRIIRSIKNSRETLRGTSARNADLLMKFGRLISLEETEQQYRQVTSEDIRRVAADMLRGGIYALAGVGPQETMPSEQDIKNLMQAQLQGVALPVARPGAAFLKSAPPPVVQKEEEDTSPPKITTLKNGMKIITVQRPGPLSCGAWVGVGSVHETPALNGATHMNEHMMFKGTPSYGPGTIDKIVESELCGDLNAYTSNDKTAYYFYNLEAGALEKVVDICGEMVFKANLDQAEFDGKLTAGPDGTKVKGKGERDVVVEEIGRSNDNVDSRQWNVMMGTAYPNQSQGRPVLGTEATLRAMTAQQLAVYRDAYYTPDNVVFCAAGPVRHEDFVALIESKYGSMPQGAVPPLPTPVYHGGSTFLEHENADLCGIMLVTEGVSESDPDKAAYEALGTILGGGMSSRLYKEVVIDRELSSVIGAGAITFRPCGIFYITASTAPEKVKPLIETVYDEIRALAGNVTQAELDKAKISMEMSLLSEAETNQNACNMYACNTLATGRLVTPAEISAQIQKLTLEDIKRVANRILASKPTLSMVVPKGTDQALLPTEAEVMAFREGRGPGYKPPCPPAPGANP